MRWRLLPGNWSSICGSEPDEGRQWPRFSRQVVEMSRKSAGAEWGAPVAAASRSAKVRQISGKVKVMPMLARSLLAVVALVAVASVNSAQAAWKEKVLHDFSSADTGGYRPNLGVMIAPNSAVYGSAFT